MINEMKNVLYYTQLNNYNCISFKEIYMYKIGTNVKLVVVFTTENIAIFQI